MRTLYFVFMYILLAEVSAQYQVDWIFTSGSGVREPFTALESANKGVLVGTYNGKIYHLQNSATPVFTCAVPHRLGKFSADHETFAAYGSSIRTFDFKGQPISSDTILFNPLQGTSATVFALTNKGFYGMHGYQRLSKHTPNGELIWQIVVHEDARNLRFALGNNSIYVYSAFYNGGNHISRYDTSGTLIWRKSAGSFVDQLLADEEGNFYLIGVFGSPTGAYRVLKFNDNGELLWENQHSIAKTFFATFKGDSLILCGGGKHEGLQKGSIRIISTSTGLDIAEHYIDVVPYELGEVFTRVALVGKDFYCSGEYGQGTPFLVKLSDSRYVGIKESAPVQKAFSVFPNHTSSTFTIRLSEVSLKPVLVRVTNIMGQTVKEEKRHAMESEFDVNLSSFSKGVYFVEVSSEKGVDSQKIILE